MPDSMFVQLYSAIWNRMFDLDRYAKVKSQAGQRSLFGDEPASSPAGRHDVSSEPRDSHGEWTASGPQKSAKPDVVPPGNVATLRQDETKPALEEKPMNATERKTARLTVEHSKGYSGKRSGKSYVARIDGHDGTYGLSRDFLEPDETDWGDSQLYKKSKGSWKTHHDVTDGIYEIQEHGEAALKLVYGGERFKFSADPKQLGKLLAAWDDVADNYEEQEPAFLVRQWGDARAARRASGDESPFPFIDFVRTLTAERKAAKAAE